VLESGKARDVSVIGTEYQEWAYLNDLTTKGTKNTPYTNPADQARLHAEGTEETEERVPGLQIDGYFRDDSKTTKEPGNAYGNRKFPNDSQFVMRFPNPDLWNGKLVITGPSGVRGQYANDFMIGDFVLKKGYAYAATDKGNSGTRFYCGGRMPGDALAEWHQRVEQLAIAAKRAAATYYEKSPSRTYITGISNGGYLTRYALERTPELYDGGVDWEGVLWRSEGPNLLTYLPSALNHYPQYRDTKSQVAHDAMIEVGFAEGSEFLWDFHYSVYWGVTQRIYREEFDPYWPGSDAEYNYAQRLSPQMNPFAQEIKDAVARVSLSGDIGKPLITLHGTLDALLPIKTNSDEYVKLVDNAGKSELHRYYTIEGGNHIDWLYDNPLFPDEFREKLQPILPCYRASFELVERWVEEDSEPPESQSVPKPEGGEVVNTCPPLEM
jgi:pimeloyl-ACP methyl ester carboxylesterase